MELIKFATAKPGSKAYQKGIFSADTPHLQTPSGPGMENVIDVPVPQSGLSRAAWFEANRYRSPMEKVPRAAVCSPGGLPSIGANERMVMGAERDDMLGALVLRDHNWVNWNDPATEQSEDVARIWNSQTMASNGLWDYNYDVYVSEDATSIWD